MTAVGLGGPLSGGALAADVPTTTTPELGSSTATEAAPETPPTTTTTTTAEAPPSTGASTETTATSPAPPATTPASTPPPTTSAPATTPTTTTPATGPTGAPTHSAKSPQVVIQHEQESTEGATAGSTPTSTIGTPAPSTPKGSANIAPAPQLAAGAPGALAALIAGSIASDKALEFYRIPLFLLPIYQAAAVQYGVPWQILAAINEVETDFGTDLNVSTAGAVGWMQFMPETWLQYGVDAVDAGYADPYNPVDAIFAAARYLHAAGASKDLHAAILAYNHSEAYAQSVLLRARLFASYPASVIGTLTGLTEGSLPFSGARLSPDSPLPQEVALLPLSASSPTAGATAAVEASKHAASKAVVPGSKSAPSPAVSAARAERAMDAASPPAQLSELVGLKNAPVIAVEDGRIVGMGLSRKLGDYVVLRDTYGDLFTYAGLGSIAPEFRLPKPAQVKVSKGTLQSGETGNDPTPSQPASAGRQLPLTLHVAKKVAAQAHAKHHSQGASGQGGGLVAGGKVRVFAHPGNPDAIAAASMAERLARLHAAKAGWHKLQRGSVVTQGTVLGHLSSDGSGTLSKLRFAIRPAGSESAIDPRPILENWKQLEAALHPAGAKTGPILAGATASDAFLLSKEELRRAVLADPGIKLEACDRQQVATGKVGRQALALLVFLSRSGLKPTVGELRCGRSAYSASGVVSSHHATNSVDITAVNGVRIADHQGAGTITDITIRTLLTIQHRFAAKRIVSLMKYPQAPSTLAARDHSDYIQVDLADQTAKRAASATAANKQSHSTDTVNGASVEVASPSLDTSGWRHLVGQIGGLQAPKVTHKPSPSAIRDKQAALGNNGLGASTLP
jgi:hypothetical protein